MKLAKENVTQRRKGAGGAKKKRKEGQEGQHASELSFLFFFAPRSAFA